LPLAHIQKGAPPPRHTGGEERRVLGVDRPSPCREGPAVHVVRKEAQAAVRSAVPCMAGTPEMMAHHREARPLSAVAEVRGCVHTFHCSGASAWSHGATFM